MRSFKKTNVNMRSELLEDLIRAYLSGNAPSRTSVCEDTGVCKATASKVASALVDSGFMCERMYSSSEKERPRLHLYLRDSVRFLLIDLSTPRFRMIIISNDASTLFETPYNYDSSIAFEDNLSIFLSRCGLEIKRSGYTFAGISVLYSDQEQKEYLENRSFMAYLPSIKQKDAISRAVYDILRKTPDTHLTVSDAISAAVRYNATNISLENGASYIFVGSRLLAFHSYPNGSKVVCSPERLLSAEDIRIADKSYLISKEELDRLFTRLCEFMDAAFSPSVIILESDRHTPDDLTARAVNRSFALSGRNAPLLNSISNDYSNSVFIHGVIRSTAFELIKKYVTKT